MSPGVQFEDPPPAFGPCPRVRNSGICAVGALVQLPLVAPYRIKGN